MHLKEQSVKKQAISRYYLSIASILSSKESSNYNKIVCIAGVNDTGDAPEKSNISANIRKKLKSLLGLFEEKTRGEKSGGTVPFRSPSILKPNLHIHLKGDINCYNTIKNTSS